MELNRKQEGATLTVAITGRLDTLTAPSFSAELEKLPDGVSEVVIDLSETEYVSSAGLRAFAVLARSARQVGAKLSVVNLKPEVRAIFDMTGFSMILGLD